MLRKFRLKLTDARLRAVMQTLETAGPGIGDLAERPGDAPSLFRPLHAALSSALRAGPPRSLAAASAAEEFAGRLEKTFSDMARLDAPPDRAAREALLHLQRACGAAGGLLSVSARAGALAELKALCAAGRRVLSCAKAAADSGGPDFPQNLKFSSIYSGLNAVFDALERCGEALFRI